MPRGGKREGAGRPKVAPEQPPNSSPTKNLASEILQSLAIPDSEWDLKHPNVKSRDIDRKLKSLPCHCEVCLWRRMCLSERGQWPLEYLWNRRDGKPVHTVNHLHDKPIEMNLRVSYAEVIQKARKRALE